MNKHEMIRDLQAKRAEQRSKLDAILDTVHTDKRTALTETERQQFDAVEAEVRQIDERIAELDRQVQADDAAADIAKRYAAPADPQAGPARTALGITTTEPQIYRSGPRGKSYFKDLYLARAKGDREALDRLVRNDKMVAEQRAISTGAGAGGELVPPLWLEDQFIKYVRPGRVTANLCTQGEIPPGTDAINLPKIATGTAVAPQATQNTGVQSTDLTTTSIAASVLTIAGGQTISMQLVEQSPLNIDDLVLEDLGSDYSMKLDAGQILGGTGSGGTAMGLLNLAGTNSVAWTQATPALGGAGGLYSKIANAIQLIDTTRFKTPDAIVMHPRRWWWAVSQSDTSNRPLVVPNASSPMNVLAKMDSEVPAEGLVGEMLGLPVYVDANIPTNLGAGTNQDAIIVGRFADYFLWEGEIRAEAFQQTYAQNLSLFCRLYNYVAFQAARYLASTAVITGTGAIAPTF